MMAEHTKGPSYKTPRAVETSARFAMEKSHGIVGSQLLRIF